MSGAGVGGLRGRARLKGKGEGAPFFDPIPPIPPIFPV